MNNRQKRAIFYAIRQSSEMEKYTPSAEFVSFIKKLYGRPFPEKDAFVSPGYDAFSDPEQKKVKASDIPHRRRKK